TLLHCRTLVDGGGIAMHKTMIGAAAGLALLVIASLTWDANATILTRVRTPLALPIQTVACWCGWLGAQRQHSEAVDLTDALVAVRAPLEPHHACRVQRIRPSSIAKPTVATGKIGA